MTMNQSISAAESVLSGAGYQISHRDEACFYFEDESVMGAVFVFDTVANLLENWSTIHARFLNINASNLRSAPEKAWNLYSVFLSPGLASSDQAHQLALLEEDFRATRKLGKAGVTGEDEATTALLPLLPLQNEVNLGVPDIEQDLKGRLDLSPAAWESLFNRRDSKLLARILVEEA